MIIGGKYMRYGKLEKQKLLKLHYDGMPIGKICADNGIPISTFYRWRSDSIKSKYFGQVLLMSDYEAMKRRVRKLEDMVTILQSVECNTIASTLKEKLYAIEKLQRSSVM